MNRYKVLRREDLPSSFDGFNASEGDVLELSIQNDDQSCELFVAKTAECLSVGKPLFFAQNDMAEIRNIIDLDVYRSFIAR